MHLQPLPSVMGCIAYVKLVSVRRRAMLAREIEGNASLAQRISSTWNRYRFQTLCDMPSPLQTPLEANRTVVFRGVRATHDSKRS